MKEKLPAEKPQGSKATKVVEIVRSDYQPN